MGMDIRLARIDDRLIHGQVATAWSKKKKKRKRGIQEVIEKRTDPQYEKRIDGCRRLAQWEWIYVLPESTIG
jgi:hypothetical protein